MTAQAARMDRRMTSHSGSATACVIWSGFLVLVSSCARPSAHVRLDVPERCARLLAQRAFRVAVVPVLDEAEGNRVQCRQRGAAVRDVFAAEPARVLELAVRTH